MDAVVEGSLMDTRYGESFACLIKIYDILWYIYIGLFQMLLQTERGAGRYACR